MPNWAYTKGVIVGPDEDVKAFQKKLKGWLDEPSNYSDIGPGWIGNILIGANLVNEEGLPNEPCTGEVLSMNNVTKVENSEMDPLGMLSKFEFIYESSWSPIVETWKKILEQEAPNCVFYYLSSDPAIGLYISNDIYHKFFNEEVYVVMKYGEKTFSDFFTEVNAIGELVEIYYKIAAKNGDAKSGEIEPKTLEEAIKELESLTIKDEMGQLTHPKVEVFKVIYSR